MKTCGTCEFRATDGKEWRIPKGYFLCGRVKHADEAQYHEPALGQKAIVIDGSGYFAALCVEDDFGCALWQQKADKAAE